MTVKEPLYLLIIALAVLPFLRQRPGAIFNFSSFLVLPKNKLSAVLLLTLKTASALVIVSLALALAGLSLKNIRSEVIEEGAQIVFVRDLSGSMFTGYFDQVKKLDRAAVATNLIKEFAALRPRDQYGLIDFGSPTVTRSRLTFDRRDFLEVLGAPPVNLGGTVIDRPLTRALGLFPYERSIDSRAVILVSDGWGAISTTDDIVRWMKDLNVNFWWIFIGDENDWRNAPVHQLVERLGPQAKKFRADNPAELEEAMAKIRRLQRGIIRRPVEFSEYPLDSVFYGLALGSFAVLGLLVILELSLKPKRGVK